MCDTLVYISSLAMNRLRITGPFYYIRWALIDNETAEGLITGGLDKMDWSYEIEGLSTFRSLYGAIEPEVYLNDELLFSTEGGSIDESVARQLARGQDPLPEISDQFATSDVKLQPAGNNCAYYICLENCEGDEYREFEGAYEADLLSLRKATFIAGREIETIYQVNYKGANIVGETESAYDGFYVYREGNLVEV